MLTNLKQLKFHYINTLIIALYSRHFEIWSLRQNKSYLVSFYLFNQVNTWLQIQTKVNELPLNTFPLVLFLQIELLIKHKIWLVYIKFRNISSCTKHSTSSKYAQHYLFFSRFTIKESLLSALVVNFHASLTLSDYTFFHTQTEVGAAFWPSWPPRNV